MANEPAKHHCDKHCFMCDRPNDTFLHLHLAPKMVGRPEPDAPPNPDELVICIPCISGLAQALNTPIRAYVQGGYMFDAYAADMLKRKQGPQNPGIPLPKYFTQAFGMDDDNDG